MIGHYRLSTTQIGRDLVSRSDPEPKRNTGGATIKESKGFAACLAWSIYILWLKVSWRGTGTEVCGNSHNDCIVPHDPTRSRTQIRPGDTLATSCNTLVQSESSSRLVRHASSRSVMSSRAFTPADLFKALELIQFVGCQTQHQLIAALRMLIPLIDTEPRTTQTERHRGSLPHTFANEGTCSTPSFTAYHLQVDRVLNTVIEMYTERKISSRAKKKKASERGRHEVGQKLGMVEDLVCQCCEAENIPLFRDY